MTAPDGFQIGTVFVQVLPSLRHLNTRTAAKAAGIRDIDINVEPHLATGAVTTEMKALEVDLARKPIVKEIELNERKLTTKLAELAARRDEMVVRVDADVSAAQARIDDLERKRGKTKINVDAEIAKAEAKIRTLTSKRNTIVAQFDVDTGKAEAAIRAMRESSDNDVDIDVDVHIDKAEAALNELDHDLKRLRNNQSDINIEASDASRAIALIGALTAAVSVLGYIAPAVAAAVATIPNAVLAAGQGFGAVRAALSGVSDATKAISAVEDEAVINGNTNSKARVAAAGRLQRALENADRSAIQSAHQVAEARDAVSDAVESGARRVQAAERSLTATQRDALDAQEALTRARVDAAEKLEDLHLSTAGAAIDEEAAVISLQRARDRLTAGQAAGVGGLDLAELQVGAKQAQQSLAEVRERLGDLRDEQTNADRAGIEGSDAVMSARRRVEDQTQRVADAEAELSQTRQDGSKAVADAQERVSQAQQQASWAAADASREVADAMAAMSDSGSAAIDKLQLAMSKLSPEGQQFAQFLAGSVKPALKDIGAAAASTMLPKVQTAFGILLTQQGFVADAMKATGDTLGDIAIKGAQMVTSGPWREDFGKIVVRNNRLLEHMGNSALSGLDALRHLTIAAGPLTESLFASADGALAQAAAFLETKRETGELQHWFAEMQTRLSELFSTVGQIAGGFWDLTQALAPLGKVLLDIVGPLIEMIGSFAEANPTLTTIIALAVLLGSSFISLFRTIGGLGQAISTSVGVFNKMKEAVLGTVIANKEAGEAATRTGGLMGKAKTQLAGVTSAFNTGAASAQNWASRFTGVAATTGTAVSALSNQASTSVGRSINSFLPATSRVQGAMSTLANTVQTSFSRVAGAVGGAATATAKGVGAIVGGVGAALGPFGLAIAGITIGLGLLAQSQAEAAQEAAAHKAQIEGLTSALVDSNGVVDDSVRKQIRLNLQEKEVADNAKHLGLNLGQMIRAVGEGGQAAADFEAELFGVADQIVRNKDLSPEMGAELTNLANEIYKTGGKASDFAVSIDALANGYQASKGATDEQTDAFRTQITELLDLVGGYKGAKGDFRESAEGQKDIARAQEDAASSTENHYAALKKLNDAILGAADKDLAYRQSQNSLAEAHQRVADVLADESASSEDLTAAKLAEEQAMLRVIDAAGALAFANSTATSSAGRQKDETIAQATAAAELANKWVGPLPASLQIYLDKMAIAKDQTGQYIVKLDEVPPTVNTDAVFDDTDARAKVEAFGGWIKSYFDTIVLPMPDFDVKAGKDVLVPIPGTQVPAGGGAFGAITIPAYAAGGIRSMSGKNAQIVPPNTPRVIGDRMQGKEGFVPINDSPRSIAILTEIARQMGFGLMPMAFGGILGMADGGITAASPTGGASTAGAALTLDPAAVTAFSDAVQSLITQALAPLAVEVNSVTLPAMQAVDGKATELSVVFAQMRAEIAAQWQGVVLSGAFASAASQQHLLALQNMVRETATVFSLSTELIRQAWAKVPEYTAAPVRASIQGPYNQGLIPAWSYLNTFFALNKPINPLPIPFATGGTVPGTGNRDSVLIAATPGEYILSKPIVKKWGLSNIDAAHQAAKRGGFPGLEGMFSGETGGFDVVPGFASGGPVPEALARATKFGQSMHGKPYVWGGSSEAGTDCSGWMAMLARSLMDVKPYARREWATSSTAGGNPPPRFANGIDGLFAIGVNPGVHTAGTLAGRNVESGGAHNFVAFGAPATGADDGQFPLKFHLPELGGKFVSGGGGGEFSLGSFIRDAFTDTFSQITELQKVWGANSMAQAGAALTSQAADAIIEYGTRTIQPQGTSGDVESWRPMVLQALSMLGLPPEWADITLRRLNQESGGNPLAVNNWDVNAQRGDPSKGLMQVIGSTFRAHRDNRAPDNVLDPLANILASMKYAMSRYGSLPAAYGRAGGYDSGGLLPPGYSTVYNGLNRPEMVLTESQWNALISLADMNVSGGGDFSGNLYLSSGEFLGAVEGVIDRANTSSGRTLARRIR